MNEINSGDVRKLFEREKNNTSEESDTQHTELYIQLLHCEDSPH